MYVVASTVSQPYCLSDLLRVRLDGFADAKQALDFVNENKRNGSILTFGAQGEKERWQSKDGQEIETCIPRSGDFHMPASGVIASVYRYTMACHWLHTERGVYLSACRSDKHFADGADCEHCAQGERVWHRTHGVGFLLEERRFVQFSYAAKLDPVQEIAVQLIHVSKDNSYRGFPKVEVTELEGSGWSFDEVEPSETQLRGFADVYPLLLAPMLHGVSKLRGKQEPAAQALAR